MPLKYKVPRSTRYKITHKAQNHQVTRPKITKYKFTKGTKYKFTKGVRSKFTKVTRYQITKAQYPNPQAQDPNPQTQYPNPQAQDPNPPKSQYPNPPKAQYPNPQAQDPKPFQQGSYWEIVHNKILSIPAPSTLIPSHHQPFQSFPPGTKILFVGNPGTGKSTLLNSLIQTIKFKSGVSTTGVGMTMQLLSEPVGNIEFIDTPGLSDIKIRKQAAEQIQIALSQNGTYYLFFIILLVSGRVRTEDLTTMQLVLNALQKVENLEYGMIVNKVSRALKQKLASNLEDFKELMANLNLDLPVPTDNIFFFPSDPDVEDQDNVLMNRNEAFERYIEDSRCMKISAKDVGTISIEMYEDLKKRMEEETTKLRVENERLMAEINRIEKENSIKIQKLEDELHQIKQKMNQSELGARDYESDFKIVSDKISKDISALQLTQPADVNIAVDNCVAQVIGNELWNSPAWEFLKQKIERVKKKITALSLLDEYGLTMDEALALTYYTSDMRLTSGVTEDSFYYILNRKLQSSIGVRECIPFLRLIKKTFHKLPKFKGTTYRGINRRLLNEDKYQQKGYRVFYLSFTSTSSNHKVVSSYLKEAKEGAVLIFESTFSGISLADYSLFPTENEVLFYPGTTFEVVDSMQEEKKLIVTLKEVATHDNHWDIL